MGLSEQPAGSNGNMAASVSGAEVAKSGAGFGWWWHTPDDTLDKIDPEVLVRDTKIYAHAVCRLLTETLLPFDYRIHAEHMRSVVTEIGISLDGGFDLMPILVRVEQLAILAQAVRDRVRSDLDDKTAACINHALMKASRALVPVDYTSGNRFIHDPALPMMPFPVLDPIRNLARLAPGTDEYRLAAVRARRGVRGCLENRAVPI